MFSAIVFTGLLCCPSSERVEVRSYYYQPVQRVYRYETVQVPVVQVETIEVQVQPGVMYSPLPSSLLFSVHPLYSLNDVEPGDRVRARIETRHGRVRKMDVYNPSTGVSYRYRSR